jgi:hypothetical protein
MGLIWSVVVCYFIISLVGFVRLSLFCFCECIAKTEINLIKFGAIYISIHSAP